MTVPLDPPFPVDQWEVTIHLEQIITSGTG
jgi:hypothetical protein